MSIKYMNQVWDNQELKHGRLITMLALADHANDAGECWPSHAQLEEKTRLTDRQLRRVIAGLAHDGYLTVSETRIRSRKRPMYRLFPNAPGKADKMSASPSGDGEMKADKMSENEPDKMSAKESDKMSGENGQNVRLERTKCPAKADIFDTFQSRARSEPPIEPSEPPKEEDDDLPLLPVDSARDAVHAAWRDQYGEPMPANLIASIDGLTVECGAAAVIHGIVASVASNSRSFRYIAQCARNYVPEPPASSYAVATPGDFAPLVAEPFPAKPSVPDPPQSYPAPDVDPWAVCLAELRMTLPNMAATYLAGSRLEAAGEVEANDGGFVPLYRVVVGAEARAGLDWLKSRGATEIRRRLSSVFGRRVLVEIVAEEPEGTV